MFLLTKNRLGLLVCLVLTTGTLAVYWPLFHYGFITYDDPDYIVGNDHVKNGLTWPGIAWAFTSADADNWHPLTWISHMIDCQLFGLEPAGHHVVNVLFHTANALLLFLLLNRLTGAIWRSALVAALFAWHPLHVESVAWASERKDVLSAFFALLALISYARYARDKSRVQSPESRVGPDQVAVDCRPWTVDYIFALLFFACGLMSKPMVVTLPFVMLLMDFWPLQRLKAPSTPRGFREADDQKVETPHWIPLVQEKIPFLLLTIVSCVITLRVQQDAMWSPASLPLALRLENVAVAYIRYLFKIVWPSDMALIYPYPTHLPASLVLAASFCLGIWTAVFIQRIREKPYLLVGWLWFLGTLVPVIGMVQVGAASMADRYTYLPSIGVFIMAVWGLVDLLEKLPERKIVAGTVSSLVLAGCLVVTSIQLRYWHSSLQLFWHTIKVTNNNYAAYDCFGKALEEIGKKKEAEQFYADAVHLNPQYPMAQFDLALILLERGDTTNAPIHLAAAVHLSPRNAVMQYDYGVFLSEHGRLAEAVGCFQAALTAQPGFVEAQRRLDALQTNAVPDQPAQ